VAGADRPSRGTGKGTRKKKVAGKAGKHITGRPVRLAHLVTGTDRQQRRERNVQAAAVEATQRVAPSADLARPSQEKSAPFGKNRNVLCLPNPEWLPHVLTISGPREVVADFRLAAAGAGTIPWVNDYDRLEEDWVNAMLTPPPSERGISLEGARILAHQLRERVELQDAQAAQAAYGKKSCPFDLNALLPVPDRILHKGPDDPDAIAWLWENWGTTWALRGVEEIAPDSGFSFPADHDALSVRFWSADWTPWRALASARGRWPANSFHMSVRAIAE
jgi:hypothetical protein